MKLTKVTFTGVDELTDLYELIRISRDFPFVEWGLLLSSSKSGMDNRYPNISYLDTYNNVCQELQTSVHLCGRLARDAAKNRLFPIETVLELLPSTNRVQVNLGDSISEYIFLTDELRKYCKYGLQMIIQSPSFQNTAVRKFRDYSLKNEVVFLHDSSGGRGIEGKFEVPVNSDLVGFAGGFNPSNVKSKLESILEFQNPNDFWIDMESGVRTDNWFDTKKVVEVLEIVGDYIGRK